MKGTAFAFALALVSLPGCGQEGEGEADAGGPGGVDAGMDAQGNGGAAGGGSGAGGAGGEAGASGNAGSAGEGGVSGSAGQGGEAGQAGSSGAAGSAGAVGGADAGDEVDAGSFACPAAALGQRLGRDRLLVGGSMDDADFAAEPFDVRYKYLAGAVPADGPCASCASNCQVDGQSCANAGGGCAWWGCWQWDQDPPGRYAADLVQSTTAAGGVPMITYYIWYSVAGNVEGAAEIAALSDGALVSAYLADLRFLCRILAESPAPPVILHLEPDLWGYAHQVNDDPALIPAAVSAAGASECASLSDSVAGLARCMLAIARAEAPNVLVGFHASAWGEGHDAYLNADPGFDLGAHATETARFMRELGASEADLVVVEMSDRDAGFNGRWWDETDATLPSFEQAISWVSQVGDGLGLAPLWWQVPYGHMGLENTTDRFQDNRVDYFFDHPDRFVRGGAIGIAFGAGAGGMTTPASDDGHFLARAGEYFASERPRLCGD